MKLIINGQEVTATEIRITGVTTLPAPAPGPEPEPAPPAPGPEPEPTPPPAPDQPCGDLPRNVVLSGDIDLANPGSQRSYELGSQTRSIRFVMTSSPSLGKFSLASMTGTLGVTRCAWISRCPGGDPVSGSVKTGAENATVAFANHAKRGHALLHTGDTYYFNFRNGTTVKPDDPSTCASGSCGVYLMTYTD
jgi:hypothetical protein